MSSSAESQAFSAPASYILYVHATEKHPPDNCSFTPLAPPCVSCSLTDDQDFILYCNHNHVGIYLDIYTKRPQEDSVATLRRTVSHKHTSRWAVSSASWDWGEGLKLCLLKILSWVWTRGAPLWLTTTGCLGFQAGWQRVARRLSHDTVRPEFDFRTIQRFVFRTDPQTRVYL